MGIKLEWAQFSDFDHFNVYRSLSPIDINNPPALIATNLKTMYYYDNSVIENQAYYYQVASVKNGTEKLSAVTYVETSGLSNLLVSFFANAEKGMAYNLQDLSTLWQDVAGTIPVTAVDQFAARVDDLSGNGNHLIQTDVSRRPQLKQDADGFYLWFDGTKYMYSAGTVDFNDLLNFTTLCRFTKEENIIGCILESSINSNSNTGTFSIFQESNNISLNNAGSGYNSAQVALDNDSLFVGIMKVLENPKIKMMRVNGVEKTRTGILNQSALGLLNHNIYVGARGGTSLFLKSKVRALAFVGRELTGSEIENIESLLMP